MRNPGEFDYNEYLNSLGISGVLNIYGAKDIIILNNEGNVFESVIFSLRKFLDWEIKSLHNKQTASLLKGLLLADRSEIDYVTKTQFINAGVIHVLAVSGLHVGFVAIIFIFLFGRLNIYLRSILTIVGLLLFMFITGLQPSVFRATVMAVIIIIAFMTNRSTNLFNSLALASIIILVLNPEEIFNPGISIIIFSRSWNCSILFTDRKSNCQIKIEVEILKIYSPFYGGVIKCANRNTSFHTNVFRKTIYHFTYSKSFCDSYYCCCSRSWDFYFDYKYHFSFHSNLFCRWQTNSSQNYYSLL